MSLPRTSAASSKCLLSDISIFVVFLAQEVGVHSPQESRGLDSSEVEAERRVRWGRQGAQPKWQAQGCRRQPCGCPATEGVAECSSAAQCTRQGAAPAIRGPPGPKDTQGKARAFWERRSSRWVAHACAACHMVKLPQAWHQLSPCKVGDDG